MLYTPSRAHTQRLWYISLCATQIGSLGIAASSPAGSPRPRGIIVRIDMYIRGLTEREERRRQVRKVSDIVVLRVALRSRLRWCIGGNANVCYRGKRECQVSRRRSGARVHGRVGSWWVLVRAFEVVSPCFRGLGDFFLFFFMIGVMVDFLNDRKFKHSNFPPLSCERKNG